MTSARLAGDAGSLDTSYGTQGIFSWSGDADHYWSSATHLIHRGDGKVILIGSGGASYCSSGTAPSDLIMIGLTASGQLDSTFGSNGVKIHNLTASGAEVVSAVAGPDSAGNFYVAGNANSQTFLKRFSSTGTLSSSITHDAGGYIRAMALASDSHLLVGSDYSITYGDTLYVTRYNTGTGAKDTAFGTSGNYTYKYANNSCNVVHDLKIDSAGKILVAFASRETPCSPSSANHAGVLRLTASGAVDTAFNGGVQTDNGFVYDSYGLHLSINNDGQIAVVTSRILNNKNSVVAVKLNSDGTRASNFGTNGTITTFFGQPSGVALYGMSFTSEGAMAVTGYVSESSTFKSFTGFICPNGN
jgi:uncharacterized delta-60 repeat protein